MAGLSAQPVAMTRIAGNPGEEGGPGGSGGAGAPEDPAEGAAGPLVLTPLETAMVGGPLPPPHVLCLTPARRARRGGAPRARPGPGAPCPPG